MRRIKNGFDIKYIWRGKYYEKRVLLSEIQEFMNENLGCIPSKSQWFYRFNLPNPQNFYDSCTYFYISGTKKENAYKSECIELKSSVVAHLQPVKMYEISTF